MPINKNDYPSDWKTIALTVKAQSNWRCENCDRPCRQLNEAWIDFLLRLESQEPDRWINETEDAIEDETGEIVSVYRPQRFTLTVAHLDHTPMNVDRGNLKAFCSGCHLRYDAQHHAKNASATRYRKKEEIGQLSLLESDR